jgi:hypothetical protein
MKIGDKVKLNPNSEWNNGSVNNPLNIEGEIDFIDQEPNFLPICVRWVNGKTNSYNYSDLLLNKEQGVQECDARDDEQRTKS